MPNVVLEAMASRRPVVATDVEGVRELLGSGAEGQTVPYGDTQLLPAEIVALMGDRPDSAAIGSENRQRVEANFGISRMVAAYEELWASLHRCRKSQKSLVPARCTEYPPTSSSAERTGVSAKLP